MSGSDGVGQARKRAITYHAEAVLVEQLQRDAQELEANSFNAPHRFLRSLARIVAEAEEIRSQVALRATVAAAEMPTEYRNLDSAEPARLEMELTVQRYLGQVPGPGKFCPVNMPEGAHVFAVESSSSTELVFRALVPTGDLPLGRRMFVVLRTGNSIGTRELGAFLGSTRGLHVWEAKP